MLVTDWIARKQQDKQREGDHRSPFQRDRGRILHSEAFRCLQAKTQIHAVGEDDFYRTRLTHSLEVAQIGSSIRVKLLNDLTGFQAVNSSPEFAPLSLTTLVPSRSLIESLCFAHDIGHPPFGHGGEMALNYKMHQYGGFEGNAQTFRIVTQLEPYTKESGMNLTRRTLLGLIKYPAFLDQTAPQQRPKIDENRYINLHQFKTSKGLFRIDQPFFNWVLAPLNENDRTLFCTIMSATHPFETNHTLYKSLDCSIMELSDDIAYGVHDLEDAIAGKMVSKQIWQEAEDKLAKCSCNWIKKILPTLSEKLFSNYRYERKEVIGALVNYFITNVRWQENPAFHEPLLRYNAQLPDEVKCVLSILKQFVYQYVISDVKTQRVEYKGQRVLMELFDMLSTDPQRLLPAPISKKWQESSDNLKPRIICDYLASISDGQAFKLYQSL